MFGLKIYEEDFSLHQDEFSAISGILEFIETKATDFGTSRKEVTRISMMCEEALVKLLGHADFSDSKPITA